MKCNICNREAADPWRSVNEYGETTELCQGAVHEGHYSEDDEEWRRENVVKADRLWTQWEIEREDERICKALDFCAMQCVNKNRCKTTCERMRQIEEDAEILVKAEERALEIGMTWRPYIR